MSEPSVWNGMTRAELDRAYNNMAAVPDSGERLAAWSVRSAALRQAQPGEIDIPYGPAERNRFDVFRCGRAGAPLIVFIHGGWWRRNSKEVFSCMAEGPLARGFDVALIGYTLAPEARMARIVAEIRAALDAVAAHQAARGDDPRLILSGWSAGGHLTAVALDHPAVIAGVAISGVFDLEPIRLCSVADVLDLTREDVAAFSPARNHAPEKPLSLTFGLSELPEMRRQSADYAVAALRAGRPVACLPLADHDHFSILDAMTAPDGAIVALIAHAARK